MFMHQASINASNIELFYKNEDKIDPDKHVITKMKLSFRHDKPKDQ